MRDILAHRLSAHLLDWSAYGPYEVVKHMLCMQAQDLTQNKRAIASRAWCSHDAIVASFNAWEIVRTWTQRGTIHTVAAQDAWRMVTLCASKTLWWFKKRRAYLGITEEIAERSVELIRAYLSDWPKTRSLIGLYLTESWIPMQPNWIYHLLCFAGTLWVTVQWPVVGWEQAFVLTEQWIPSPTVLSEEEALRELCLRYFSSHGPATIEDLQRRSGLWKTQIKQWIAACGKVLSSEDRYYFSSEQQKWETSLPVVHFLAWFDERLLGYKDRTATLAVEHHTWVDVSRNGVFKPTVMVHGKTLGVWSVNHKSKSSEITITPFETMDLPTKELLSKHIGKYQKYLAKEGGVSIL